MVSLIHGGISEYQRDMNVKGLPKAGKGVYKVLGVLMDMYTDGTEILYLVQCSYFSAFLF